ncbi:adenosylhomocysteinase [Sporobacter termitidis DSM 10068]|uniref:Adenosylhomocysteinase n=1 Tax=Sporobacter termitidis DSM 10068 TaxID=1123282 RepID=A0A1M5VLM4_9FIRM|nr:adenosylhomocysteinase [Sporobacter termitidis]SHH76152.1 adenosylhomocysteinase [Sporobacter termitidis DSM 10068]
MSEIRDKSLAASGERKIAWARRNMPLLNSIEKELSVTKPFKGLKVTLSVHMEAKTASLCRVMQAAGAEMHVTGCNPLSTQDDVAAALAVGNGHDGPIDVYAWHGATTEEYERHLTAALETGPNIIIDDGGDLVNLVHTKLTHLIPDIIGGCEETTTGVMRLHAMARDGLLKFPMITVNNAQCKYLFDNRYGTGQSVWDGINRTTNLIVAGKDVVVAGYGWCGKGIAMRGRGFGARIIVTEVDPVKALEAMMDGFEVMPMAEAAKRGDLFITATGCRDIITEKHFGLMKDGAVMCNAGHFNVEVDVKYLEEHAVKKDPQKPNIMGYTLQGGKTLFVLAEGRLVNLASGDGHPVEIMDMSFAIQALSAKYLADHRGTLSPGVIPVPEEIDTAVAIKKLSACGLAIDTLTGEQKKYLGSWGV